MICSTIGLPTSNCSACVDANVTHRRFANLNPMTATRSSPPIMRVRTKNVAIVAGVTQMEKPALFGHLHLIGQADVVRSAADHDVEDVGFNDKLMHIFVVKREF